MTTPKSIMYKGQKYVLAETTKTAGKQADALKKAFPSSVPFKNKFGGWVAYFAEKEAAKSGDTRKADAVYQEWAKVCRKVAKKLKLVEEKEQKMGDKGARLLYWVGDAGEIGLTVSAKSLGIVELSCNDSGTT